MQLSYLTLPNYHMKVFKLFIPFLVLLAGCKKQNIQPTATANVKKQGYIIVNCDNCQIAYGMPDQYKEFNAVTASPQATFTYVSGYILQVYVTALDHEQKLTLKVYDSDGKSLYANSATQALTSYWTNSVLLN
jgi:hypothetical protein